MIYIFCIPTLSIGRYTPNILGITYTTDQISNRVIVQNIKYFSGHLIGKEFKDSICWLITNSRCPLSHVTWYQNCIDTWQETNSKLLIRKADVSFLKSFLVSHVLNIRKSHVVHVLSFYIRTRLENTLIGISFKGHVIFVF